MILINEIKRLVGRDKIDEAIQLLLDQTKDNSRVNDLVLLISGRYEAIEKDSLSIGKQDEIALSAIRRDILGINRLLEESTSLDSIKEEIRIEIKIDTQKEDFTKEKQDQLLQNIAELLDMGITDIRLGNPRKGSIILPMELPADKAEKFLELIDYGDLEEFKIIEANNIYIRLGDFIFFFEPFQESIDLSNANLEGADLRVVNLNVANLEGADLQNSNLQNANLKNANLRRVKLNGGNLQDANLQNANLKNANLEGANLQRITLEGANLLEAKLNKAILLRANLKKANLRRANLNNAYLNMANLSKANLEGANLLAAILEGVNLWGTILWKADLKGADLRGAKFRGAKDQIATLKGAKLDDATAYLSQKNSLLEVGADISGVNFVPDPHKPEKKLENVPG